ncbi:MAG: tetratricopeptide repeat protein [Thermoanaerobaculia bacterium]
MKHRCGLTIAALCVALQLSAESLALPRENDEWITLTADEFQFISNASPKATLRIARDMLRMRAAVGQITNMKVRSPLPTKVFIFDDEREFGGYRDAMMGRKSDTIVGVFSHADAGNFILMRSDTGGVDRIIYHELTHYFVQNTTAGMPLWLNEGLAEFYSTFATDGTAVHIGRPIAEHVLWLRGQSMIPLKELFTTTTSSGNYNERSRQGVFYAESWALVHYLMTDAGRRARLIHFLGELGDGKSIDDAFTASFGMKFTELEQDVRGYVRLFGFRYLKYPLDEMEIPEPPKPEPMARDALLFQFGHLLAHSGPATADSALRFLRESLALNPENAPAHADLGRLHEVAGRRADAEAAYTAAVELGSDDPEVFLLAAYSLMQRYEGASPVDVPPKDLARIRKLFQRVTELDPNSANAWTGLGSTYVGSTEDLAIGIAALEKSLALAPGDDEAAFYLAQLYANAGRRDEAARLVHRLESSPTLSPSMKNHLRAILEFLERAANHDRAVAALNDAIAKANAGQYSEALALVEALLPSITDPDLLRQARKFRDDIAKLAPAPERRRPAPADAGGVPRRRPAAET